MSEHKNTLRESDVAKQNTLPANKLKKGDYVILRKKPCKIIEIIISFSGKSGKVKIAIIAQDFSLQKCEDVFWADQIVEIFNVKKYLVCKIDKNHLTLQDENGVLDITHMLDDTEICNKIKTMYNENISVIVEMMFLENESKIYNCYGIMQNDRKN